MSTTSNTRRRSGGPKTESGKARSALNATRHGLAARHLLLPGEDQAVYEQRTTAIFESFAPANEAEAELVALVADDMWRLDRLARIEQGLTSARIEDLRSQTTLASDLNKLGEAVSHLGRELVAWEQELAKDHPRAHCIKRMSALDGAVTDVMAASLQVPEELFAAFDSAMYSADKDTASTKLPPSMYEGARKILVALLDIGRAMQERDAELREAVANVALPDEAELKKVQRYRRTLEEGLQRRLALLEKTRALTVTATPETSEKAREFRVKLRLVPT